MEKNLDITKPRFSERNRGSTVIKRYQCLYKRRSVTSGYHGKKISGPQQQGV